MANCNKEKKHGFSITNWRIYNKLLLLEKILMSQQEQIDALAAQLDKVKTEILAQVAALQAQIDAGGVVDLTALTAAVQSLDDLNPDA